MESLGRRLVGLWDASRMMLHISCLLHSSHCVALRYYLNGQDAYRLKLLLPLSEEQKEQRAAQQLADLSLHGEECTCHHHQAAGHEHREHAGHGQEATEQQAAGMALADQCAGQKVVQAAEASNKQEQTPSS